MAAELTRLYSIRMNSEGFAFSPDIDMQSDFERRFEFDETDDQLVAINEIKKDMKSPALWTDFSAATWASAKQRLP